MGRSKRAVLLAEFPFAVLSSYETFLRIEEFTVRRAPFPEEFHFLLLSEHFRSICDGSVRKGIFKIICNRLIEKVARYITIFHPMFLSPVRPESRCLHRLESKFIVYSIEAFDYRICHRRYAGISDHTVCLATMKMPDRKLALLLIYPQHRVYEVTISLWLEYAVERHRSPVCIP